MLFPLFGLIWFFIKDSEQPWPLQADGKWECGQDDDDWWRNRERSTQVWIYLHQSAAFSNSTIKA